MPMLESPQHVQPQLDESCKNVADGAEEQPQLRKSMYKQTMPAALQCPQNDQVQNPDGTALHRECDLAQASILSLTRTFMSNPQ
jgi:hypothetical protein